MTIIIMQTILILQFMVTLSVRRNVESNLDCVANNWRNIGSLKSTNNGVCTSVL